MKTKVILYIQAVKWVCDFGDNAFNISVTSYKRESDENHIVIDIDEQEVEIDVPEVSQKDLTIAHIEQLKGIKVKFQAEAHMKIKSIDEQIENLLSIENKVGE